MLFNSYEFIFIFFPIVVTIYFVLNSKKWIIGAKIWLVLASLFFYSWWNFAFLPIIIISILVNYSMGQLLLHAPLEKKKKGIVTIGILFNVGLLAYFKYADFFIASMNGLFKTNIALLHIALPLAISFFTFQQIAFLVDCYNKETIERNFLNYCLFIVFFPQLIAGPIVHHKEMMPQFAALRNKLINYKHLALGVFIFAIGLFKKVMLADRLAVWATKGYDELESLSLLEGWIVSYAYTFQLYFDFSGYMDMAIGIALFFNITLPINFNSPFKASNIQETWSRWHITLGRFLYRYIYKPMNKVLQKRVFIPLGLKKHTSARTNITLVLLFLISGLWHGAGWTFVLWGLLHGMAQVIHRKWKQLNLKMNKWLGWFITFNFLNFSLIFFRANSFEDAGKVIQAMLGFSGVILPPYVAAFIPQTWHSMITFTALPLMEGSKAIAYLLLSFMIILCFKNSNELLKNYKPTRYWFIFTIILLLLSILHLSLESEFLYFNF